MIPFQTWKGGGATREFDVNLTFKQSKNIFMYRRRIVGLYIETSIASHLIQFCNFLEIHGKGPSLTPLTGACEASQVY